MAEKSFLLSTIFEGYKITIREHISLETEKSLSGQIALDQNNKVKPRNW